MLQNEIFTKKLTSDKKTTDNVFVPNSAILTQILTFLFDPSDEMDSLK